VVVDQRAFLPDGADVVVRALPAAGAATYQELGEDFRSALPVAVARSRERATGGAR